MAWVGRAPQMNPLLTHVFPLLLALPHALSLVFGLLSLFLSFRLLRGKIGGTLEQTENVVDCFKKQEDLSEDKEVNTQLFLA